MIKPLFIRERSNTTALRQPKEFGKYSRKSIIAEGSDHYVSKYSINDDSFLSYYYLPNDDLDKKIINLSGGFSKFKDCSPVDDLSLYGLLETIMENEKKKSKKTKVELITMRGIIKSLILLFNSVGGRNTHDGSKIDIQIITFDGQIFMKNADSIKEETPIQTPTKPKPQELSKRTIPTGSKESQYLQKCQYSGYKFETCATLPKPVSEMAREKLDKRYKKIANNDEQYITLVKTGIGHCKMILGAEVDGVFDFKDFAEDGTIVDNLKHYIELKTTKLITNAYQAKSFETKLFNAWLQCFLVGVPRVTFGFRDEDFNLVAVEEFFTNEIPVNLKNLNSVVSNYFADCIKWYGAVIEWLMANLEYQNGEENYYRLHYQDNHLKLERIPETEEENVAVYKNIISQEFRDWRASIKK